MRVVLDTNVLVAALRSVQGASYALLSSTPSDAWTPVISVPLYCQYQDVLLRPGLLPSNLTPDDIREFCRYLASIADTQEIFFLWRPILPDEGDDLLLEVAVAAQARYIITYNLQDFRGVEQFGITAIRPGEFLQLLRGMP